MTKVSPFLLGARVYLRAIEETDLPLLHRWLNAPNVRTQLDLAFPTDLEKQRLWYAGLDRSPLPTYLIFAVVRTFDDAVIGTQQLKDIDWRHRNAMSGSLIGEPSLRGQGFGPEAKNLLLRYAFDDLGLMRIGARVTDSNEASLKGLAKCGYKEEGRIRKSLYLDGQWHDDILLGVLADEWRALQKP
jgi:RimJ/RimL family protein N-acetyltransferase